MKFFVVVLASALLSAVSGAVPSTVVQSDVDNSDVSQGRDLIGSIVDTFACRSTSQDGFPGRCVHRGCCAGSNVENLCSDIDSTCCYGRDRCLDGGDYDRPNRPIRPNRPHRPNRPSRRCPEIVTRSQWGARKRLEPPRDFRYNVNDLVIVHHTGDERPLCDDAMSCNRYMQHVQRHYQNKMDYPDLPWNFIISRDGLIFQGQGWHTQGYHTKNRNEVSYGIAFIGDFNIERPSRRALAAFDDLMDCGYGEGFLSNRYVVSAHSDYVDTQCPGRYLRHAIRDLEHFSDLAGREFTSDSNSTQYDA